MNDIYKNAKLTTSADISDPDHPRTVKLCAYCGAEIYSWYDENYPYEASGIDDHVGTCFHKHLISECTMAEAICADMTHEEWHESYFGI